MLRKTMITLFVKENNPLTPNFYNKFINSLQFHQLICPCGHSGCLSVHGYYNRSVKTPDGKLMFKICRVICECCGHTHALLLSSMVPYSQVSFCDHISIVSNYESGESQDSVMNSNPLIDEGCYRYIIKCYKRKWRERLRSESISLTPIFELINSCFAFFSQQFMQIKNTSNVIFFNTT